MMCFPLLCLLVPVADARLRATARSGEESVGNRLGELGPHEMTYLVAPDGVGADAFYIASENFRVLMRYNPSVFYALSISVLAEQLAHQGS
eukprot:scaffold4059_cov393-Prasinococcus_capsulatus_cf.AAC.6